MIMEFIKLKKLNQDKKKLVNLKIIFKFIYNNKRHYKHSYRQFINCLKCKIIPIEYYYDYDSTLI